MIYTKEMNKDYTILMPQMSPIHFDLLKAALRYSGYKVDLLGGNDDHEVDLGLKYVTMMLVILHLLLLSDNGCSKSGKYDLKKLQYSLPNRWWLSCN